MHITDFDYHLPDELIATEPLRPRDISRMMTLDRRTGVFGDSMFRNLPAILRPGDVLISNDTRVIKARMIGVLERASGSRRKIEVLFANPLTENTWEVLSKPGRRIHPGDRVIFGDGHGLGVFGDARADGLRLLTVTGDESVPALLDRLGHIPLPPYMKRPDQESDSVEYQTMFAALPGAVAAPTAGLHFTPGVLEALKQRGVEVLTITLHVGIGTFLPVREDDPSRHRLKPERFNISEGTARAVNTAKAEGRRVLAVGTTTTRTLEYAAGTDGLVRGGDGEADIFILPGYRFRVVDGLLTNFHLPRSTLLMLVSAFSTREFILRAYAHAVEERYRFFSYGDCVLLL